MLHLLEWIEITVYVFVHVHVCVRVHIRVYMCVHVYKVLGKTTGRLSWL